MPDTFGARIKRAWNALRDAEQNQNYQPLGPASYSRPERTRLRMGNERSIVNSVINRIAMDVASIPMHHVRLDENEMFLEAINSGLNNCLSFEANIDQTARAFIQDVAMSLCDEGVVAIVPVDCTDDPKVTSSYDVLSMRTGKIKQWYPRDVRIEVYNDQLGIKKEITVPKSTVAIVENPLFSVMNEPNSTLQRLIYKLNILDAIDEQSGAGKLDIFVQLPYPVKSDMQKARAEQRRLDIESQLKDGKYGIAYIDAAEKVTQLNRPAENNLMGQIQYLTKMLYAQLGITEAIFDGTANEEQLLNYFSRTIEPFCSAIANSMAVRFISKTARTQGQSIIYIKDPFKFVPTGQIATIADSLTRNAVFTSNEIRGILGYKPSGDKDANTLRNKNLNPSPASDSEDTEEESSLNLE